MEVVEVSPPYDVADITLLGGRVIADSPRQHGRGGQPGRPATVQPAEQLEDEELSERQPGG
ncbi:MAG: hypothetical protein U0232_16405 [Thermomicrobiales bacterium]